MVNRKAPKCPSGHSPSLGCKDLARGGVSGTGLCPTVPIWGRRTLSCGGPRTALGLSVGPSPARLLSRMFQTPSPGQGPLPQRPAPNRLSLRDLRPVAPYGPDWKPRCTVQLDGFRKRLAKKRLAKQAGPQESIHPEGRVYRIPESVNGRENRVKKRFTENV